MRALLLVHGLTAFALLGSALHLITACLPWLWGAPGRPRLAALHAWLVPALAFVTFALGLWLYPTYKLDVRLAVFDAPRAAGGLGVPWVSRLFDLKEHLAALALPAAFGLGLLGRAHGPAGARERPGLFVGLSAFVALATAATVLIGMFVVSWKAVS